MAEVTRKLILTGAHAGATIELRKLQFVNGECQVAGPEKEIAGLCRYMGNSYRAYCPDTPELAHYQALDKARLEAADGASEANTQPGPDHTVGTPDGSVQPTGTGPATPAADNGSGADETPSRGTEQHTNGDGQQGSGPADQPVGQVTLQQVILQLDATDDELWTAGGQPRMDAVAAACGREDVTRKEVEAAVPGFLRPAQ